MNFVLAVRHYLKGLALYQIVRTLYPNKILLKDRVQSLQLQERLKNEFEGRLTKLLALANLYKSPLDEAKVGLIN